MESMSAGDGDAKRASSGTPKGSESAGSDDDASGSSSSSPSFYQDSKPAARTSKGMATTPITPTDLDVVTGHRGAKIQNHPGNRFYRRIVSEQAGHPYDQILDSTKKAHVALLIVSTIRSRGGRFLRAVMDHDDSGKTNNHLRFEEMGETEALAKTSQALRSGSHRLRQLKKQGSGPRVAGADGKSQSSSVTTQGDETHAEYQNDAKVAARPLNMPQPAPSMEVGQQRMDISTSTNTQLASNMHHGDDASAGTALTAQKIPGEPEKVAILLQRAAEYRRLAAMDEQQAILLRNEFLKSQSSAASSAQMSRRGNQTLGVTSHAPVPSASSNMLSQVQNLLGGRNDMPVAGSVESLLTAILAQERQSSALASTSVPRSAMNQDTQNATLNDILAPFLSQQRLERREQEARMPISDATTTTWIDSLSESTRQALILSLIQDLSSSSSTTPPSMPEVHRQSHMGQLPTPPLPPPPPAVAASSSNLLVQLLQQQQSQEYQASNNSMMRRNAGHEHPPDMMADDVLRQQASLMLLASGGDGGLSTIPRQQQTLSIHRQADARSRSGGQDRPEASEEEEDRTLPSTEGRSRFKRPRHE